jgi:cytochrome c oxidase cbb3-type subunit 3
MYSPVQIKELTSYVRSLLGTKPANPKDPQGNLYQEAAAIADSTSLKTEQPVL